jgi:predicted small secreted protein
MVRGVIYTALVSALFLSGCDNTFEGANKDYRFARHIVKTGIIPRGYPEDRQAVNYHQTQFGPHSGPRYLTSIPRRPNYYYSY